MDGAATSALGCAGVRIPADTFTTARRVNSETDGALVCREVGILEMLY